MTYNIIYRTLSKAPFRGLGVVMFLLCTTLAGRAQQAYADHSVLADGRFVKVQVTESGLYRLPYADLRAKGIDPANVRLFGYGGAMLNEDFSQPAPDDLPEVPVYDTGDAILFYAQGVTRWTYDADIDMFTHVTNPYSDHGYYFVTSDEVGEKRRVTERAAVVADAPTVVDEFTDYALHEEELYSPVRGGRELYGERMAVGEGVEVSFHFPHLVAASAARVRLDVINISTMNVDNQGNVTRNNRSTFTLTQGAVSHSLPVDGRHDYDMATPHDTVWDYTATGGEQMDFALRFANANEASATGYLNFLEVNAQRKLVMDDAWLAFHNRDGRTPGTYHRYELSASAQEVVVWDVTDPQQAERIPVERAGQTVSFVDEADRVKSYVAFDPEAAAGIPTATLLDEVPAQDLHGMEPADMLIITHPDFQQAAERLALAHADYNGGLRATVVTAEEVYNEFSSGTPDATAYRRVCKMLYDRYRDTDDALKYLLLMGKGSFDNRGRLSGSGSRQLLTFQASASTNSTKAYGTDDYFGLLGDAEGTSIGGRDRIDIGIGRLPVLTAEEAEEVVDKIIRYMQGDDLGPWRNRLSFLGDDGDSGSHMRQANTFADNVTRRHPGYLVNKVLLDAYQYEEQSSSFPEARRHFQSLLADGQLMVTYMGHGNVNGWGDILNLAEIRALTNEHLPLFVSGTCEFSRFDREYSSAGEELCKLPDGGGIGVFSACRTVYQNYNETLVRNFVDSVMAFSNQPGKTIGDAVRAAKNASFGDMERIGANTLSYVYFGDPAVRLHYPTDYEVQLTDLSDVQGNDTLKALSVAALRGQVTDLAGNPQTSFNGEMEITLLDKEESRRTLGNDGADPFTYRSRNTVSLGKTRVQDGEFTYTFLLPDDIKYNYGGGKFLFYARDTLLRAEAQGHYSDFTIGGYNEDFVPEADGPDADVYLDDPSFASGDCVDETPVFHAEVYDPNGINLYSATPGHDLVLCVDNEHWYDLADHYESTDGDYRAGTIAYELPEQTEGKHTLTFRAWDMLGNSTLRTLKYEVVGGWQPAAKFDVTCWPNPVHTTADIRITYADESEVAQVTLELLDLAGRRMWTRQQEGTGTVSWQVTDGATPPGIYVLRVSVRTQQGDVHTKTDKIIVAGQ